MKYLAAGASGLYLIMEGTAYVTTAEWKAYNDCTVYIYE